MKRAKYVSNGFLRSLSFVAILSLAQIWRPCHAQYLTGPVASSLGGAGRAASDDGEQILLNPAAIVHGSPFTSSLFYSDGYTALHEHDRTLGLSLSDNTEGLLASGGYVYANRRRIFDQLSTREEQYHQFSIGRFLLAHLSLGISMTYLDTKVIGGKDYNQLDANMGLLYNPIPDLAFGLVVYNLGPRSKSLPPEIQNLDKISVATHYLLMPNFRMRVDISQQQEMNPDKKIQYQLGLESKFSEFFMFRLGYDHDQPIDRQYYTVGLGFNGPRLKVDYIYRKNPDYKDGAMHGVDMRMPFW